MYWSWYLVTEDCTTVCKAGVKASHHLRWPVKMSISCVKLQLRKRKLTGFMLR